MKIGLLALALGLTLSTAAAAQSPDGVFAQGAVAAVLDGLHAAAASADEEKYFAAFAPDAVFLGTDATERWTLDGVPQVRAPVLRQGKGLDLQGHRALDRVRAGPYVSPGSTSSSTLRTWAPVAAPACSC